MARCGCGGACSCQLTAGDNINVSGSGTAANPWVVSATTDCTEVRACFTSGNGTTYNQANGSFDVCISPVTPNALTRDANGCLRVLPGAASVTTGCGLTGVGTPADPVRASVNPTWPYPCDLEDNGGGVFCGADGRLYTDPTLKTDFFTDSENVVLPGTGLAVPAAETVVRTASTTVTNPDPCRPARVAMWQDVDMDIDYPPGSSGGYGIAGDDMYYFQNETNTTIGSMHTQVGKMRNFALAPGQTLTINVDLNALRGSGNARIRRIQWTLRSWVIADA
ncbi:hypothetical protein SEA_MISCHIEF19_34 [Streptomyces phage Mischief19]|nr:hypothetical protein SEA_MISCHIEF19_34 [Streptomyces phage Mischief19]